VRLSPRAWYLPSEKVLKSALIVRLGWIQEHRGIVFDFEYKFFLGYYSCLGQIQKYRL